MFKWKLGCECSQWYYSQQPKDWNGKNVHQWINKVWHIHTMEYHSFIERNEEPTCATTRMNLENITRSNRSRTSKPTYCINSTCMTSPYKANPERQKADPQLPGVVEKRELLLDPPRFLWEGDGEWQQSHSIANVLNTVLKWLPWWISCCVNLTTQEMYFMWYVYLFATFYRYFLHVVICWQRPPNPILAPSGFGTHIIPSSSRVQSRMHNTNIAPWFIRIGPKTPFTWDSVVSLHSLLSTYSLFYKKE